MVYTRRLFIHGIHATSLRPWYGRTASHQHACMPPVVGRGQRPHAAAGQEGFRRGSGGGQEG
eukprot:2154461-Pyramimonas_sp.AAC.2